MSVDHTALNGELNLERVTRRIAHIRAHLDAGFKLNQLVRNIENELGNPRACVMSLFRRSAWTRLTFRRMAVDRVAGTVR
jgi:hypothetical protein